MRGCPRRDPAGSRPRLGRTKENSMSPSSCRRATRPNNSSALICSSAERPSLGDVDAVQAQDMRLLGPISTDEVTVGRRQLVHVAPSRFDPARTCVFDVEVDPTRVLGEVPDASKSQTSAHRHVRMRGSRHVRACGPSLAKFLTGGRHLWWICFLAQPQDRLFDLGSTCRCEGHLRVDDSEPSLLEHPE